MEESGIQFIVWIVILIVLLWLNGILHGFAGAIQNLNESDIEKKAIQGDKNCRKILYLMHHTSRYMSLIPVFSAAAFTTFGALVLKALTGHFPDLPSKIIWCVAGTCISSVVLGGVGVLAFKRAGAFKPESFALRHAGTVDLISKLFRPVYYCVNVLSRAAAMLSGVSYGEKESSMTEEEIISIVDEAHEQGVIEENEAEMIRNIISFNETAAGEIMTHRKDIVAFDEEILLQEMTDRMMEEGSSRYPVYRGDLDNIVGITHYKDAVKFINRNPWAKFMPLKELPGLIREADYIPETRGIGDLCRMMQNKKIHMAVVVDEYGQTAGIVSMEDILEEIVGDILDEYDDEEVIFRNQVDNSVLIDGMAPLDEVGERLGIEFPTTDFETLNGYLTSILGHVPTMKDLDHVIATDGYRFRIISLGNRTIGKVKAEKIKAEKQ